MFKIAGSRSIGGDEKIVPERSSRDPSVLFCSTLLFISAESLSDGKSPACPRYTCAVAVAVAVAGFV